MSYGKIFIATILIALLSTCGIKRDLVLPENDKYKHKDAAASASPSPTPAPSPSVGPDASPAPTPQPVVLPSSPSQNNDDSDFR